MPELLLRLLCLERNREQRQSWPRCQFTGRYRTGLKFRDRLQYNQLWPATSKLCRLDKTYGPKCSPGCMLREDGPGTKPSASPLPCLLLKPALTRRLASSIALFPEPTEKYWIIGCEHNKMNAESPTGPLGSPILSCGLWLYRMRSSEYLFSHTF